MYPGQQGVERAFGWEQVSFTASHFAVLGLSFLAPTVREFTVVIADSDTSRGLGRNLNGARAAPLSPY